MVDMIASPYIHAATADNFRSPLLDNSTAGPVLVNFWSRKAMLKVFATLGMEHALFAEYRPQLRRHTH